jgi:transposase InsO family protein
MKAGEEHKVAPNLLNRNFIPITKRTHFSTDVTELPYQGGRKAYLSAMKDLATNEIVHFNILQRPTGDLVITNLEQVFEKYSSAIRDRMIIHSDQGVHYTSKAFRAKLVQLGINQSMSRRGNCLDNSPIESFFGHLKDEVDFRSCKNFTEVKNKIENYMNYYNNERPQWGLKQKTPAEAGVSLNLVF